MKNLEDLSPFVGPLILLFWTSGGGGGLGFKAKVNPSLVWLCAVDPLESPLVRHLLTSWWSAWQLSLFDPHTCISCVHKFLVGVETKRLSVPRHNVLNHSATPAYNLNLQLSYFVDSVQWLNTCINPKKSIPSTQKHFVTDCPNSSRQVQTADQCIFSQTLHTYHTY